MQKHENGINGLSNTGRNSLYTHTTFSRIARQPKDDNSKLTHENDENMDVTKQKPTEEFNRFNKGDVEAFAFFYKRFINDLYTYGRALGGEKEIVQDIIHDVFIKIYVDRNRFESIDHLKYFLLKSLKNTLYNTYHSKRMESTTGITDELLEFSLKTTVLDRLIDEEDRECIQQRISKLLQLLTPRQKEAIYLRFIQEQSYERMADILCMTPHAVRKLISRSLKRLKEQE